MNHPLYIAPDEEIISVIARLRTLSDTEVTLVFPKHSVVTQSIINLKLLAREGEKLQKRLTLVSQNENARALAEKIGFTTLPYTQEMEKGSLYVQGENAIVEEVVVEKPSFAPESDPARASFEEAAPQNFARPKSAEIGSQGFYKNPSVQNGETKNLGDIKKESAEAITPASTTLRVRNMSPERPPSLNSVRTQEAASASRDMSVRSTVSTPIFPDNLAAVSVTPTSQAPQPPQPQSVAPPTAIQDFFNRTSASSAPAIRMPENPVAPTPRFTKKEAVSKKATPPVMVGKTASNKLTAALVSLVVLLVVVSGALGFFLVFPTATVIVTSQKITDSYDQSFTLDPNNNTSEIPLQKRTDELTVNIAGIASGAAGVPTGGGDRAKGTIKISNNYSAEAQPLVATTRFETSSGKIYRIQESVTVPGNGSVEATVIADGSGDSYNANEGTLTIPGFKGTDKYEKFSASISKAITGGGGSETASSGTFIRADEETLRQRAAEEVKSIFGDNVDNSNGDTYTFTDGLVVERVSEANMPKVGSVPGEYEYSAVFKVTAYTTSKEKVTEAMLKNIRSEYDNIRFQPASQELSFADFTVNEKGDQASLKAHLETELEAELKEDQIKKDLAGKSAQELANFTTEHPEIKGLSISFHPAWALKRIPSNMDKIELVKE